MSEEMKYVEFKMTWAVGETCFDYPKKIKNPDDVMKKALKMHNEEAPMDAIMMTESNVVDIRDTEFAQDYIVVYKDGGQTSISIVRAPNKDKAKEKLTDEMELEKIVSLDKTKKSGHPVWSF